jgi:polyphosphate kinase 2 (PPK2 family)
VHPIGAPTSEEQGRHWLYRFWTRLPAPGTIAIFDRTWYGRVLVEKVDKLAPNKAIKRAYGEINQFEAMLKNDGIEVIKIYLALSKKEQERRFEDRMRDPYKQWKYTKEDVHARKKWDDYVDATEKLLEKTSTKLVPWHVVPADSKHHARKDILNLLTDSLKPYAAWMERHSKTKH